MKQSRKGAAVQFFGLFNMFTIEVCSETGLFKNLTNYVFRSVWFQKYITYEGHLSLQDVQNLM